MGKQLNFLDLFAGAGGLSEGFMRAGFEPVAHVESDSAACYTLRTRMAYHWLKNHDRLDIYIDYLNGTISRPDFYKDIPSNILDSVINTEIGKDTLSSIFERVDSILKRKKLHLIIGGPPCQAYSLIGRSRDSNGMMGDKRNFLYIYYAEFLKRYKPKYFVFENVTGLLSARDQTGTLYLDTMRDLFHEYGYQTEYRILSAQDYGVLQSRKRVILVGKRGKSSGYFPMPSEWDPRATVKEIFKDLPAISAGGGSKSPCRMKTYRGTWLYESGIKNDEIPVTLHESRPHTEQDLEIYKIAVKLWNEDKLRLDYNSLPERLKTHRHRESFTDRFKVVPANLPYSHTVVAHISKDGHYYIHPDVKQNRSITPREAARLQTFPDDYFFESIKTTPGRTAAFKQIGNAVPVLLSSKIAEQLAETW